MIAIAIANKKKIGLIEQIEQRGEGERMLVLAGDIGGTSTRLAYFDTAGGKLSPRAEGRFPSREAGSLDEIVGLFGCGDTCVK